MKKKAQKKVKPAPTVTLFVGTGWMLTHASDTATWQRLYQNSPKMGHDPRDPKTWAKVKNSARNCFGVVPLDWQGTTLCGRREKNLPAPWQAASFPLSDVTCQRCLAVLKARGK